MIGRIISSLLYGQFTHEAPEDLLQMIATVRGGCTYNKTMLSNGEGAVHRIQKKLSNPRSGKTIIVCPGRDQQVTPSILDGLLADMIEKLNFEQILIYSYPNRHRQRTLAFNRERQALSSLSDIYDREGTWLGSLAPAAKQQGYYTLRAYGYKMKIAAKDLQPIQARGEVTGYLVQSKEGTIFVFDADLAHKLFRCYVEESAMASTTSPSYFDANGYITDFYHTVAGFEPTEALQRVGSREVSKAAYENKQHIDHEKKLVNPAVTIYQMARENQWIKDKTLTVFYGHSLGGYIATSAVAQLKGNKTTDNIRLIVDRSFSDLDTLVKQGFPLLYNLSKYLVRMQFYRKNRAHAWSAAIGITLGLSLLALLTAPLLMMMWLACYTLKKIDRSFELNTMKKLKSISKDDILLIQASDDEVVGACQPSDSTEYITQSLGDRTLHCETKAPSKHNANFYSMRLLRTKTTPTATEEIPMTDKPAPAARLRDTLKKQLNAWGGV
ncbi:MAG: hypothetical protein DHS20C10_08960 [marine bacterium B5-7]|nr:MAG: hypothetical protein DHS20C10_08960 [marine bacterium B5-7]